MLNNASEERRGHNTAAETIVVAIPAALKSLAEPISNLVDAAKACVERLRRDGRAIDYAAIEREVAKLTGAIETNWHRCALEAMTRDDQRIEVSGQVHTRVSEGVGTYYSRTGPIEIHRGLYRRVGERNGPTVDVLALRIGAIGGAWLPATAKAMAHELQRGTSREAELAAAQNGVLPYSRASFERVAHLIGELWLEHHADLEDSLIRGYEVPAAARSVSVSIDRTSVPMEEPRPRPPGRPRKNAPKRWVQRVFRQCYCATVTLHDSDGRALHTLRRGQMPNCDPQDLCHLLANDVVQLRERRPDLELVLLADGAPEMWKLLDENFPVGVFGERHRGLDFWHVIEKLAAAAKVLWDDGTKAKAMTRLWRKRLRKRKDAAQTILAELVASGREHVVVDGECPVHDAITYLRNNGDRMDFARALSKGLPIGSGNVEATCKTLVGLRMKRCGSRWHNDTGNHILHLRALALSDRWDDAMNLLSATQRTAVRRLAA